MVCSLLKIEPEKLELDPHKCKTDTFVWQENFERMEKMYSFSLFYYYHYFHFIDFYFIDFDITSFRCNQAIDAIFGSLDDCPVLFRITAKFLQVSFSPSPPLLLPSLSLSNIPKIICNNFSTEQGC